MSDIEALHENESVVVNIDIGTNIDNDVEQKEDNIIHDEPDSEIDLKKLCDFESPDCYNFIQEFISKTNASDVTTDIRNIMSNIPDKKHILKDNDDSRSIMHRFENLLMLKIFNKLKNIETSCLEYKKELDDYHRYNKMYITYDSEITEKIHQHNIKTICTDQGETDDTDIMSLISLTLTKHKISQELLTYELLNYRLTERIILNSLDPLFNDTINKIHTDINRFNPIIQTYLEDKVWTLNTEDTLHFAVPKNKIVFSNTISMQDDENDTITTHMDMIIEYLKRCYKLSSLKYVIIEDNKYDVMWILLTVGYYHAETEKK